MDLVWVGDSEMAVEGKNWAVEVKEERLREVQIAAAKSGLNVLSSWRTSQLTARVTQ
jgi:hypothetical protein